MSSVHVQMNGDLIDHIDVPLKQALEHIGQKVEDAAKRIVPVETGHLRSSIDHKVEGDTLYVTAGNGDVDYAGFVEVGTRNMPAQPYLRAALNTVRGAQ